MISGQDTVMVSGIVIPKEMVLEFKRIEGAYDLYSFTCTGCFLRDITERTLDPVSEAERIIAND